MHPPSLQVLFMLHFFFIKKELNHKTQYLIIYYHRIDNKRAKAAALLLELNNYTR